MHAAHEHAANEAQALRRGTILFVVLTVLNVVELALTLAFQTGIVVPLTVLAIIDAAFIGYYFMHIGQLWHSAE